MCVHILYSSVRRSGIAPSKLKILLVLQYTVKSGAEVKMIREADVGRMINLIERKKIETKVNSS